MIDFFTEGLLDVVGQIFIASLRLVIVPLVFFSLVCGVVSISSTSRIGTISIKTLSLYLLTTAIAITIALSFALLFQPGIGIDLALPTTFASTEAPSIKEVLQIGKARIVKEGKKVALLNFGTRLEECKKASEKLKAKGINCTIIDARFAKPLDEKLIMEVATNHEVLITIEEGSIGGFGSHVMQLLSDRGVFDTGLKFRSMILPDIFIDQDTPEKMYELAGLDSLSIATKVEETLNSKIILAKNKNKISN